MVYILSWGRTMLIQMSSMNMAFSMGRICQRSTGILLGLEGSIHFEDRDDVPSNILDVRLEDALWWVLQHAWIGLLDREG